MPTGKSTSAPPDYRLFKGFFKSNEAPERWRLWLRAFFHHSDVMQVTWTVFERWTGLVWPVFWLSAEPSRISDTRGQCCDKHSSKMILWLLRTHFFSVPNGHFCPQITLKMVIFINVPSSQIKPSAFLHMEQKVLAFLLFFVTNL